MLIEIDESILKEVERNSKDVFKSLDLLAQCTREGHHLVYAEIKLLRVLSLINELSDDANATYAALINRMAMLKKVKANISDYIVCYIDSESKGIFKKDSAVWIPLDWFDSSIKIQPTMLVAENDSDCELYSVIGKLFSATKNLPTGISFVDMPGGGNTIGLIYKKRQCTVPTPILCIADSDKSCPNVDFGPTAKKVEFNYDPKNLLSKYEILPVRMLENLLPIKFYKELYGEVPDKKDGIRFLEELSKDDKLTDVRKYIHFKNGICYEKIAKTDKPAKLAYWNSVETDLRKISKVIKGDKVMPSFGSKILEHALDYFSRGNNILDFKDDEFTSEYAYEISAKIYSWGCATGSLRNF